MMASVQLLYGSKQNVNFLLTATVVWFSHVRPHMHTCVIAIPCMLQHAPKMFDTHVDEPGDNNYIVFYLCRRKNERQLVVANQGKQYMFDE